MASWKFKFKTVEINTETDRSSLLDNEVSDNASKVENRKESILQFPVLEDIILQKIELKVECKPSNYSTQLENINSRNLSINKFNIPDVKLIQLEITDYAKTVTQIKFATKSRPGTQLLIHSDLILANGAIKNMPSIGTHLNTLKINNFYAYESLINLILEERMLNSINNKLDTGIYDIESNNLDSLLENLLSYSRNDRLLFEELVNANDSFPRSRGESFNSPIVVLVFENEESEWHNLILYALNELSKEISEKHLKVSFRAPESYEEGYEEILDSLELNSLTDFSLESKIEFIDARKWTYALDKFSAIVNNRLRSGFLQQFGILVIALNDSSRLLEDKELSKYLKNSSFKDLRVISVIPDEKKYYKTASILTGISKKGQLTDNLREFRKRIEKTSKRLSYWVNRQNNSDEDRLQYPLKVAVFSYLLDDLASRNNELITNFEEMISFIEKARDKIKTEDKIEMGGDQGKVIPDLIYQPAGDHKKIAVEIETLAGTIEPMKKIDETINKYGSKTEYEIWIVLKPVSAVLHFNELKLREEIYKRTNNGIKTVKFKVLNLKNGKWFLESVDKIKNMLEDDQS